MNIVANFEHRASSSRGKHEGESSFARLGRTRDNSQRQLPTDHDYAVPTREYQTDQSSLKTARLLLALSSRKRKDNYKNIPTDFAVLTWSLHIRANYTGPTTLDLHLNSSVLRTKTDELYFGMVR
jgi:hypothetical protein